MPFRRLFLSRWSALIWAAGVVWTAYDVADEAAPLSESVAAANAAAADAGEPNDAAADMNAVAALLNAE